MKRIFVNTYTQKKSGNDCHMIVDLGKDYSFQSISLDQAILETLYCNFYESQGRDFRNFNFRIGAEEFNFKCNQYLRNQDQFALWINDQFSSNGFPQYTMQILDTAEYKQTFGICITDSNNNQLTLFQIYGDGWIKLGFKESQWNINRTYHFGISAFDFSLTPSVLLQISEIPSMISNGFGIATFHIPLESDFGFKTFYRAQNEKQTINFQSPVTVRNLEIRLLSCDQKNLETPLNNNEETNQNNTENIFIFTVE